MSASRAWTCAMSSSPGSQRMACQEGMYSESTEPLAGRQGAPVQRRHAYKPPCGEIAVCLRVGRMRPISDDGPGHYNPDPSEGLWGGGVNSSRRCIIESASRHRAGATARERSATTRCTKGG